MTKADRVFKVIGTITVALILAFLLIWAAVAIEGSLSNDPLRLEDKNRPHSYFWECRLSYKTEIVPAVLVGQAENNALCGEKP